MSMDRQQLWVPTHADGKKPPDPKRSVWELAEVRAYSADGATAEVTVAGRELTVPLSACHTFDPSHTVDYDDAGKMGDLHEAPLLKLLAKRHARSRRTSKGQGAVAAAR